MSEKRVLHHSYEKRMTYKEAILHTKNVVCHFTLPFYTFPTAVAAAVKQCNYLEMFFAFVPFPLQLGT